MGSRDRRIDRYVEDAASFARPILTYVRELVHETCPDVEETLKWRTPTFMYHGILGGIAAFKDRCMFGLWKGSLIVASDGTRAGVAMGQMGDLTKVSDLPARRILVGYIRQAMKLNEDRVKLPRTRRAKPKPALRVPADLKAALARNKKAREAFEGFSPSHRREYIEWLTEAKAADTRTRRLETALEWMAAGKPRNWKYMKR